MSSCCSFFFNARFWLHTFCSPNLTIRVLRLEYCCSHSAAQFYCFDPYWGSEYWTLNYRTFWHPYIKWSSFSCPGCSYKLQLWSSWPFEIWTFLSGFHTVKYKLASKSHMTKINFQKLDHWTTVQLWTIWNPDAASTRITTVFTKKMIFFLIG